MCVSPFGIFLDHYVIVPRQGALQNNNNIWTNNRNQPGVSLHTFQRVRSPWMFVLALPQAMILRPDRGLATPHGAAGEHGVASLWAQPGAVRFGVNWGLQERGPCVSTFPHFWWDIIGTNTVSFAVSLKISELKWLIFSQSGVFCFSNLLMWLYFAL